MNTSVFCQMFQETLPEMIKDILIKFDGVSFIELFENPTCIGLDTTEKRTSDPGWKV